MKLAAPLAFLLLALASTASAQDTISWYADMSYKFVMPTVSPNQSQAVGYASFDLVDTGRALAINFTVSLADYVVPGVSNDRRQILFAHVHQGANNTNGPLFLILLSNTTGGPANVVPPVTDRRPFLLARGVITAASLGRLPQYTFDSFLAAMDNGTLYTDVHSTNFQSPLAEIRGQIYPLVKPATTPVVGRAAAPAVATSG